MRPRTICALCRRGAPLCGPVAQWLEPAAHNGLVAGSSPARPTRASRERRNRQKKSILSVVIAGLPPRKLHNILLTWTTICPSHPISPRLVAFISMSGASRRISQALSPSRASSARCARPIAPPPTRPALTCTPKSESSLRRFAGQRALQVRRHSDRRLDLVRLATARRVVQGDARRGRLAGPPEGLAGAAFTDGDSQSQFWRDEETVRSHIDLRTRLGGMTTAAYAEERFGFVQSRIRRLGVPVTRSAPYFDRFMAACLKAEMEYLDIFFQREGGKMEEGPRRRAGPPARGLPGQPLQAARCDRRPRLGDGLSPRRDRRPPAPRGGRPRRSHRQPGGG